MTQEKFDQDPRNIVMLGKIVKHMCPNNSCKSLNVTIRQVGDMRIYCCDVCGISSITFIDV